MSYELNEVRKATEILNYLLMRGEISGYAQPDLYLAYGDSRIREILETQAVALNVQVVNLNSVVYMIPNEDNDFLGVSAADLRTSIRSNGSVEDGYLAQYIIAVTFDIFFTGAGQHMSSGRLLSINTLAEEVTKRLDTAAARESIREDEATMRFNIISLKMLWDSLPLLEEGRQQQNTIGCKLGRLHKIAAFMEKRKLVIYTQSDDDIRPTPRLKNLMLHYFLNSQRKKDLENIIRCQRVILTDAEADEEEESYAVD